MAEVFPAEDFNAGPDGAEVGTTNTTFDAVSNDKGTFTSESYRGDFAARFTTTNVNNRFGQHAFAERSNIYIRYAIKLKSSPPHGQFVEILQGTDHSVKAQIGFRLGNIIRMRNVQSEVWRSTTALSLDTWYEFEWRVDFTVSQQQFKIFNVDQTTKQRTSLFEDSGSHLYNAGTIAFHNIGLNTNDTADIIIDSLKSDDTTFVGEVPAEGGAVIHPTVAWIGDSLAFRADEGSTNSRESTTRSRLVTAGWDAGSIYWHGVGGKQINVADTSGSTTIQNLDSAVAQFGAPDQAIIALGTNDVSKTDQQIIDAINAVLNHCETLGIPEVIWRGIAYESPSNPNATRVNPIIKTTVNARTFARFADWAAYIHNGRDETGLWHPTDGSHMTTEGYAIWDEFGILSLQNNVGTSRVFKVWDGTALVPIDKVAKWNGTALVDIQ